MTNPMRPTSQDDLTVPQPRARGGGEGRELCEAAAKLYRIAGLRTRAYTCSRPRQSR